MKKIYSTILTIGFAIAANEFNKAGIICHSLTDYESLISIAIDKGFIDPNDQNTLLNWRLDPANWQGSSKLGDKLKP